MMKPAVGETSMRIQRFASGLYTAFCWRCRYGLFRRDKDAMFVWAVAHERKHSNRTERFLEGVLGEFDKREQLAQHKHQRGERQ